MREIIANKKVSVFYCSVWNYFCCLAATEAKRERVGIEAKRKNNKLIWDMTVRDVGNYKNSISMYI